MTPATPSRLRAELRHGCELAVGVLLVLILAQTWVIEGLIVPVNVSAGSMAPALPGPRRELACDECGHAFAVGVDRFPTGEFAACPNCGNRSVVLAAGVDQPGARVFIDRTAFALRDPRRWEPIVFRCPEGPSSYCVKRAVGLPGETVQIKQGDVYVDGTIARKNFAQVRATAQPVFDAGHGNDRSKIAPRWVSEARSLWQRTADEGGSATFLHPGIGNKRGAIDWLKFQPLEGAPLLDDVGYNQSETRRLSEVHDVMVSFTVTLADHGVLHVRLHDGGETFEVVLPANDTPSQLLRDGSPIDVSPAGIVSLARNGASPVLIEAALVDRQVLVAVDGEVCIEFVYESRARGQAAARPVEIGVREGKAAIRALRVARDIYYTHPGPGMGIRGLDAPFTLGPDEFFVLGDNSPISDDTRTLRTGPVRRELLLGRPIGVR